MELVIFGVQIVQVVVSILLVLVVLLQPGKSGDLGSIFGGGTSDSVFGAAGAVPFLEKLTRGLAVLFMISSLALGYFAARDVSRSVITDVAPPAAVEQTTADTENAENQASVPAGDSADTAESAPADQAPAEGDNAEAPAADTGGGAETAPAQGGGEVQPESTETTQ